MSSRNAKLGICTLLSIALLIAGCTLGSQSKTASLENIRQGTEGIIISFLTSYPKDTVISSQNEDIIFTLKAENKGAYPEQTSQGAESTQGIIWLSGYDKNIITFPDEATAQLGTADMNLYGKTPTSPGGSGIVDFRGIIVASSLPEGKYSPTILGNICYSYQTIAQPIVCIEKEPLSQIPNKPCIAKDISLSSQGAPVAITKVEQLSTSSRVQFKITFKNTGKGMIINRETMECTKERIAGVQRYDLDWVHIEGITIAGKELECSGLGSQKSVRLIDGVGYATCSIPLLEFSESTVSAFTTPLDIKVSYLYKDTIQQPLSIVRING